MGGGVGRGGGGGGGGGGGVRGGVCLGSQSTVRGGCNRKGEKNVRKTESWAWT